MNVREIIKKHIEDNGYDGVYTDDCGCKLEDLFPCGCDVCVSDCKPGYKHTDKDGNWYIDGSRECHYANQDV